METTELRNEQTDENFMRVYIRWMITRDMRGVLEIERRSFEFPWKDKDFTEFLKQKNIISMVAETGDKIYGFMVYELQKLNIEVLNFAVHPDYRRRSIGTQMVEKLKGKLSSQIRKRIRLVVRETNLEAQLFFRENGFRAVSVLHNYYSENTGEECRILEDAYLMQYRHSTSKTQSQGCYWGGVSSSNF